MIVLPPVESIPLNVTAIGNENTLGESIPSNAPDIPRAPMNEVVPKCRFSPNAALSCAGGAPNRPSAVPLNATLRGNENAA